MNGQKGILFAALRPLSSSQQVSHASLALVNHSLESGSSLRTSTPWPGVAIGSLGALSVEGGLQSASKQGCESVSHVGTETELLCSFECTGPSGGSVWVSSGPQKLVGRMREKLVEYGVEGAEWPLTACILDPVRASVVCNGPAQMMEVIGWILDSAADEGGMPVCRIKNKFALPEDQLVGSATRLCYPGWLRFVQLAMFIHSILVAKPSFCNCDRWADTVMLCSASFTRMCPVFASLAKYRCSRSARSCLALPRNGIRVHVYSWRGFVSV